VEGLSEAGCRAVAEGLGARFKWRPYGRIGRLRDGQSEVDASPDRAKS
jgi:hypothetical protein